MWVSRREQPRSDYFLIGVFEVLRGGKFISFLNGYEDVMGVSEKWCKSPFSREFGVFWGCEKRGLKVLFPVNLPICVLRIAIRN